MPTEKNAKPPFVGPKDIIEFARLGSPNCDAWREFYRGREGGDYKFYVKEQYKPFIDVIREEIKPPHLFESVLEVGCGVGTITHILTRNSEGLRRGHTFVASDACLAMVGEATRQLHGRAAVIRADARDSGWLKADVIHGHGLLEHLSDHDIYRTLESHQESGARVAIHYVPGDMHKVPSFGDERLMPIAWWIDKWDPTHAFSFNGGRDYVLVWRF